MQDRPLVSVLMGTLYRQIDTALLERSITSILVQSYPNFEFLICDDGSTTEAVELIDRFAEKDQRIRPVRIGSLFDLARKLNICLKESKGTLIARMDDDDYSRQDRFEKQIIWMERHPEISFLGSNVALYQEKRRIGIRRLPGFPTETDFLFRQPYVHPAMMFRRDALLAIGGYSEGKNCVLCEDYDLLLRLYEAGFQGANLSECLLDYTLPAAGKSSRRMCHRWNETMIRYQHFKKLQLLPGAYPYVIKPLMVGLIPKGILERLQERFR